MAKSAHPPPTRFARPSAIPAAPGKPPPLAPARRPFAAVPARPAAAQGKRPGVVQRAAPAADFSAWIGARDPGFAVFGVGMDQYKTANAESSKFILCTGGLGGCLGVAAYHRPSKTAFLAHIQPDTLKAHMDDWVARVVGLGMGVTVELATQATSVGYVDDFVAALRATRKVGTIGPVQNSTSIAINAKTGDVMCGIDRRVLALVT